MLYKNDKEWELSPKEKAEMIKQYGKPMIFKLPPSEYKWDEKNKKFVCRRSTALEPFYNYYDEKDKSDVQIRYVKQMQRLSETNISFLPANIYLDQRGELYTQKNDWDLNYFLCNHPMNGENEKRDTTGAVLFVTINKEKEATKKAEGKTKLVYGLGLIWNDNGGLGIERLRLIAKSYGVSSVDELSDDQVRNELDLICHKDPVEFIKNTEGERITARAIIQEAQDHSVLRYDINNGHWFYVDEKGTVGDVVYRVAIGKDKVDALIHFLISEDTKRNYEYIKAEVSSRKVTNKSVAVK